VTTPFLSPRRLSNKADQLGINLEWAEDQDKIRLYFETIKGIRDELYEANLSLVANTLTFLEVLEKDIREIVLGIRRISETSHIDIADSKQYLDKAYGKLALTIALFEDTEETNAVKRIDARIDALIQMRDFLDNAIYQWPT
jgi:hypothetical protein